MVKVKICLIMIFLTGLITANDAIKIEEGQKAPFSGFLVNKERIQELLEIEIKAPTLYDQITNYKDLVDVKDAKISFYKDIEELKEIRIKTLEKINNDQIAYIKSLQIRNTLIISFSVTIGVVGLVAGGVALGYYLKSMEGVNGS